MAITITIIGLNLAKSVFQIHNSGDTLLGLSYDYPGS